MNPSIINSSKPMFFYLSIECPTTDAQFFCHEREVAVVLLDGGGNRVPFDFFKGSPLPSSPKGERNRGGA